MGLKTRGGRVGVALAVALLVHGASTVAQQPGEDEGPEPIVSRIVLQAPAPWYIEGITMLGDRVFTGSAWGVQGQYVPLNSLGQPSRVFVHDIASGALLDTILVEGEDTLREHGLAGLKTDGAGRLYAASGQLGILRWTQTPMGWVQERYATIPDLPSCLTSPAPCSPTTDDRAPLPNDMTWDAAGNLYVSDSFQATVWKVPPGASPTERAPQVWYQHSSLDRSFGPNGLRIGPQGDRMFLAVCCTDTFHLGPLDRAARVVTLPFPSPGTAAPTDFFVFQDYVVGEGADGIAFNDAGDLYVLSNLGNKLVIIAPDGSVTRTVTTSDLTGEGAFDTPASLVFRDTARSLLVLNYAYASLTSEGRTVLELAVDDAGFPEDRPVVP